MNEPDEQTMTLIAVEHGASWPSWGSEIRSHATNTAVEAQLPHESLDVFAERVKHCLKRAREKGTRLTGAGYVCALEPSLTEGASGGTRRHLCELLLDHLEVDSEQADDPPSEGRGQLIIGGGGWRGLGQEAVARTALIDLWGRLSDRAAGRLVSLRFDDAAEVSGLHPKFHPSEGGEEANGAAIEERGKAPCGAASQGLSTQSQSTQSPSTLLGSLDKRA